MASSLSNAFALLVLGDQEDQEASTIVSVKAAEARTVAEEHKEYKKIVAHQKKRIAEEKKKKIDEEKKKKIDEEKKKAEAKNKKSSSGQRYISNGHQRNGPSSTMVLSKEESHKLWLERKEQWLAREAQREERRLAREAERHAQWLANREEWLAREEERRLAREEESKKMTLKEYEEHKALEKQQHKADKSSLSVAESTPLMREAATPEDDFQTKQKSKNGPARGRRRGTQDSRKNMNDGYYKAAGGYFKHDQDKALPQEDKTVEVKAQPAAAPDLSETNFPILGTLTKPTKSSVK